MILNWDNVELTPDNIATRQGLLRWAIISLAWGGALAEDLDEVQKLHAQAEAAQKDGDTAALKQALAKLAQIAARLLVEHEFIKPDGTPLSSSDG
jgi:hypothetical protein